MDILARQYNVISGRGYCNRNNRGDLRQAIKTHNIREMEEKLKTTFEKLVISFETSKRLVALGLHKAAVFHYETSDLATPKLGLYNHHEGTMLPAWTYEELRIMIGNKHLGCDLPDPRPKPIDGEWETFVAYFPHKSSRHMSGAEGNAAILEWLISSGIETSAAVNQRYFNKYKPQ